MNISIASVLCLVTTVLSACVVAAVIVLREEDNSVAMKRKSSPIKKSQSVPTSNSELDKKEKIAHSKEAKVHFEFGGPIGAVGVIFGLPLVIYALFFLCKENICVENPLEFDWKNFLKTLPTSVEAVFSKEANVMYLGWMALHTVLSLVLPGETAEGVKLEDGTRLKYTLSGHLQFWTALILMVHVVPYWSENPGNSNNS